MIRDLHGFKRTKFGHRLILVAAIVLFSNSLESKANSLERYFETELDTKHTVDLNNIEKSNNRRIISTNCLEKHLDRPYDISVENVVFKGDLSHEIESKNSLIFDHCKFDNIALVGSNIGGNLTFYCCTFTSSADFSNLRVDGYINMRGCIFLDEDKVVNFSNLSVGKLSYMENSTYCGGANFGHALLKDTMQFDGAKFLSQNKTITFNGMQEDGSSFFSGDTFNGPVDFSMSHIKYTFLLQNATTSPLASINLDSTTVGDNLILGGSEFKGDVDLSFLDVQKVLSVGNAQFDKPIGMNGLKFQYIIVDNILKFVDNSVYSEDVYRDFGNYFANLHDSDKEDEFFVAGKRRERVELYGEIKAGNLKNIPSYLLSVVMDFATRYNKSPQRLYLIPLIFVIIGAYIFKKGSMEPAESAEKISDYNPFLFSLDLFIPKIDLGIAKNWNPKKDHRFVIKYIEMHKLFGWIVAIAAFFVGGDIFK
jgi:hypothetical protein